MVELNHPLFGLRLTPNQWQLMLMDVQLREPQEACGLLGGCSGDKVLAIIPVTNRLRSPYRYRMEPAEQLRAFQRFEAQGLELIGIYHSHPAGPSHPSQTDIDEAYYPNAVHLIWYKQPAGWECCAFRIQNGSYSEVNILKEQR
jgi:proteasome lid subunit RPN8/RPN11